MVKRIKRMNRQDHHCACNKHDPNYLLKSKSGEKLVQKCEVVGHRDKTVDWR